VILTSCTQQAGTDVPEGLYEREITRSPAIAELSEEARTWLTIFVRGIIPKEAAEWHALGPSRQASILHEEPQIYEFTSRPDNVVVLAGQIHMVTKQAELDRALAHPDPVPILIVEGSGLTIPANRRTIYISGSTNIATVQGGVVHAYDTVTIDTVDMRNLDSYKMVEVFDRAAIHTVYGGGRVVARGTATIHTAAMHPSETPWGGASLNVFDQATIHTVESGHVKASGNTISHTVVMPRGRGNLVDAVDQVRIITVNSGTVKAAPTVTIEKEAPGTVTRTPQT
jgi:hypothetical protein